jgi:hypothetical protein
VGVMLKLKLLMAKLNKAQLKFYEKSLQLLKDPKCSQQLSKNRIVLFECQTKFAIIKSNKKVLRYKNQILGNIKKHQTNI